MTLPIVKALLGLLLLACLPALEAAGVQSSLTLQLDDLLLPVEVSDAGEAVEGKGPASGNGGDASHDTLILSGSSRQLPSIVAGTRLCQDHVHPACLFDHMGVRHATGPPRLRT